MSPSPQSPLTAVIELVADAGLPPERAELIANYVADRCAGLALTSVHSSPRTSLQHDPYLVVDLDLTRRQISAWLALLRGTRPVRRRDGQVAGGYPSLIQVLAETGPLNDQQTRRFARLAATAAGRPPGRCRPLVTASRTSGGR